MDSGNLEGDLEESRGPTRGELNCRDEIDSGLQGRVRRGARVRVY